MSDPWVSFMEASHLLERRVDRELRRRARMPHAQFEILARLSVAPERRLRMTELAEAVVASKSSLTYQVTQLEKQGLVTRSTCPGDDRGVHAVLTDEGVARFSSVAGIHAELVREHLLGALTPEQRTALPELMAAITKRLRS